MYYGLRMDPCIPSHWDGFKMRRHFRHAWYEIEVQNPKHISKGVQSVYVDGESIQGTRAPILKDGLTHQVVVILGKGKSS